ncbi:hypothetical protein [Butyrivibrio sp. AE3004]|uniref:hypothetical protein n=1 Tax=Butyrivibrio sp. AE3004 TaxID=1506994 RepID=UPI0012DDE6F1|nr:hypothetical protein [Butyrivibrio sp. AE3004]
MFQIRNILYADMLWQFQKHDNELCSHKSILAANQDKVYMESKKSKGPDDSLGYLRGSNYYEDGGIEE